MWDDLRTYNIYNTPWAKAGVITGPIYPGRGFMNRPALSKGQLKGNYWWNTYDEIKPGPFGLTEYRISGIDPRTGQPARDARDADVIYLHRDKAGSVKTHINCSNVPSEAVLCTQTWDMGEHGVSAQLRVMYRRALLEHWREFQQKVTQVVLGFRVAPATETSRELTSKVQISPPGTPPAQEN